MTVVITKQHINTIALTMSARLMVIADSGTLLCALSDPESLQARAIMWRDIRLKKG